ncbi:MAG: ferritin family protein [Phycisphaerae bacterium]|jgi:rubrerythrin|nr:ferritin family protein [Phycisphaerae bacterium]
MINLTADSVFRIAEKMERDGALFYQVAASNADENRRSVLLALAEMEFTHERAFAAMRSEFAGSKIQPVTPPAGSPSGLYLQAIAEGSIFGGEAAPKLTGSESIDRIFDIAIMLEKDSIVFYQSMKSIVPPGQAHDQLDQIIEQEIGHILELTRN